MLSRLLNTAAVSALAVSTALLGAPFATSVSISYAQQTQAPDTAEPSDELKKLDKDSRKALKKAQPVYMPPERHSLRQVRENVELRDRVRRVHLDTINFATGSAPM